MEWLSKYGPAVGSIFAAISALATLFWIARNQLKLARLQARRDAHEKMRQAHFGFWNNDSSKRFREYVVCDEAYSIIKPILIARLFTDRNELSLSHNRILDEVDVACATIATTNIFGSRPQSPQEEEIWDGLYAKFWVAAIRRRSELASYIDRYWEGLLDGPPTTRRGR